MRSLDIKTLEKQNGHIGKKTLPEFGDLSPPILGDMEPQSDAKT